MKLLCATLLLILALARTLARAHVTPPWTPVGYAVSLTLSADACPASGAQLSGWNLKVAP
jgi:hypothetical protein